ncbi:serine/threonine-protein kinase meng-po [Anabrus simplex]|uniref:serine/threonine-protein kinase meng-po n=1 Tax=Anabrus simplex TaxID=316456 RepID=UPI0035A3B20B
MGSVSRKALGGSIHRIREFELEKVNLAEEFDILQIVGEGWFGKILLAEHRNTGTEMVLKALPKPYTALRDFYREFHYSLHLGAHRNIITTYDVAFETAGFYVFSQEYAPLGDLTSNVSETGIGELHSKRVARQIASALEHLHMRELVHRDVKLDNVLVLRSDFSRVKLCDFGETRRSGTLVRRRNEWLPYTPPEVLITATDETYKAETSHDVWQFAIVVFVCLTGCLPWQKAAPDDPRYARYFQWQASSNVLMPVRRPKLFKQLSSRAQRLFRKFLEPRAEKRPASLADLARFLDDRWLGRSVSDRNIEGAPEDDSLCPSMYSFHSSAEEKDKLLFTLTQYGIETTVDRSAKKDRIREWIQSSVIQEDEEGETLAEEEEETEEGEREERGTLQESRHGRVQKLPTVKAVNSTRGSVSRSASQ